MLRIKRQLITTNEETKYIYTTIGSGESPELRVAVRKRATVARTATLLVQNAQLCLEWLPLNHCESKIYSETRELRGEGRNENEV